MGSCISNNNRVNPGSSTKRKTQSKPTQKFHSIPPSTIQQSSDLKIELLIKLNTNQLKLTDVILIQVSKSKYTNLQKGPSKIRLTDKAFLISPSEISEIEDSKKISKEFSLKSTSSVNSSMKNFSVFPQNGKDFFLSELEMSESSGNR